MIIWTDEQKAEIWRLYIDQMLSFALIAERYAHLGATRNSIAGLIGRIHEARGQEVDDDLIRKKRFSERRSRRNAYERRVVNLKLTKEEMARVKDAQNKATDE